MTGRITKSHKGTVSVLSQKGLLRLRWRVEGVEKRPVLYLGLPDIRAIVFQLIDHPQICAEC